MCASLFRRCARFAMVVLSKCATIDCHSTVGCSHAGSSLVYAAIRSDGRDSTSEPYAASICFCSAASAGGVFVGGIADALWRSSRFQSIPGRFSPTIALRSSRIDWNRSAAAGLNRLKSERWWIPPTDPRSALQLHTNRERLATVTRLQASSEPLAPRWRTDLSSSLTLGLADLSRGSHRLESLRRISNRVDWNAQSDRPTLGA